MTAEKKLFCAFQMYFIGALVQRLLCLAHRANTLISLTEFFYDVNYVSAVKPRRGCANFSKY